MINYTFGILPTIMRHDARISDFACRLYSEVDSLSNKYGYCFATNAVLAKNLKKSPSQISRTLSELEGFGYVSLVFEDGYKRKIYPKRDFRDMEGVDEIAEWGTQKCVGVYAELQKGVRKNSMTVNKIINKEKHIEIINKEKPFVEETSTVTLIDEVDETMVEIHHVPEYFEGEIPEFKLNEKGNLSPFSNFNEVINELDSKATQEKERKSSAKKKETPTPQVAPPPRPQKAKKEKVENPAPITPMFEVYAAKFAELNNGQKPEFMKKYAGALKSLYGILEARSIERGIVPLDKLQPWRDFVEMWGNYLKANQKETWHRDNFNPMTFFSQFNSIIAKLQNRPQTDAEKWVEWMKKQGIA